MSIGSWPGGRGARFAAWILLPGLLACVGGCGGSSRAVPASGSQAVDGLSELRQRYPDSRYITAEGISDAGYVQAETQARAEVAARVQSELTSVVTTVMGSTTRDGQTSDFQRLLSETTAKSSFTHAEMIRVDPAGRRLERGVYRGFAVLARAEAAEVLARDYEAASVDFRAATAELARAGADLPAWSATLRRAEAGFARLAAAAFGLRAVTRREHAPYLADLALYEQAEKERAARLSGVRLGLDIGDGAGDRGRLAASFGNALARLGLTAAPEGCPPGGYVLRVTPAVTWESGPFGPVCRLGLPGELAACDGNRPVGRVAFESKDFVGTHTRGREQALAVLLDRIDEARLVPVLRRELTPYLPVAER